MLKLGGGGLCPSEPPKLFWGRKGRGGEGRRGERGGGEDTGERRKREGGRGEGRKKRRGGMGKEGLVFSLSTIDLSTRNLLIILHFN